MRTTLVIVMTLLSLAAGNVVAQVIVIDAGHGVESSCQNCDRPDEEVLTVMSITWKLRDTIQAHCNWTVHLTRPDNNCGSCPTLTQRETMSNSWGADRFISIHANAGGGTGTETFWCNLSASANADAQAFATEVQTQMVSYGQWTNRRVVEDNGYLGFHLGVLDNNNAIGCLNEVGFYDHSSDLAKLQSTVWQGQFAKAYYIALQNDMNTTCSGGVIAPGNDNCASAIALTPNVSCINTQGTLAGATAGGLSKPTCDGFATPTLKDVWYQFQATASTHSIQVTAPADFDAVIALYASCAGTELACADGGGLGFTETINAVSLSIGNTYYVRIYDYGSIDPTTPTFNICVMGQAQPILPDLDITAGSVLPSIVAPGNTVTIDYTIVNSTNGTVGVNTETGYYLIPVVQGCPSTIPPNNFNGGTLTIAEISDGTETESHTVTIPLSTAAGNYYLVVAADQNDDLAESNESNNIFCIPFTVATSVTVSGNIHTANGSPVNSVSVKACAGSPFETDSDGNYQVNLLTVGNCTIAPFKNNDIDRINGVSTLDILYIQRHLLGNVLLSSPYKIIAGDVDVSGSVSTLDILLIRQFILGWTDYYPSGRLWRFVPDDFVFANPQAPFPHDTSRYYSNVSQLSGEDFIAMKLGDVSESWNPNVAKASSTAVGPVFKIDSMSALPLSQVIVPVRVMDFSNIVAMQGTISFDTSVLVFDAMESYGLPGLSAANFGTIHGPNGNITYSWDDATLSGVNLADGAVIFALRFNVVGDEGQHSPVAFTNDPLMQEVVDVSFNVVNSTFINGKVMIEDTATATNAPVVSSTIEVKVFPNPSAGLFIMEIETGSPTMIQVVVLDMLGKNVFESLSESVVNYYRNTINLTHCPAGTYMVRIVAGESTSIRMTEKTD